MNDREHHELDPIVDAAGVAELAKRAADAEHLAIDTESNSMHAYRERVCLIQLAIDDAYFIIDPLAFRDSREAIAPFAELLEDPARGLVLHGGEYDVAVFKREFDISMRGVFDTQQAASFLGWQRTGLGSLVEAVCEVKLTKAYAKHDWGRRPIEQAPLNYALDDVRYLRRVHEHLAAAVAEADIEEEVGLAHKAVEDAAPHEQRFNPAGFWRAKGVRDLDAAAKLRLQVMWAWREAAAERFDQPPGRLVNPAQLIVMARRPPSDRASLSKTRLSGALRRKEGEALLDALAAIEAEAPALLARPPRRGVEQDNDHKRREKKLKDWRRAEAEAREVPLAVVLPGKALAWLAEDPNRPWEQAPQLGPKRIERYGAAMRGCVGL